LPLSIIIAAVLIAGSFIYSTGKKEVADKPATQEATSTPKLEINSNDVVLGDSNAPVAIINFSDFQCPFCQKFHKDSELAIREKYVKAGKVKMVFRAMTFLGQESVWAAEADECAKDQGKFWEYHDYLFDHWNGENQGAFSKDNLKKFAADLKLSTKDFNTCFDGEKYKDAVANKQKEAQALGVRATPTIFVQDKMIQGAFPLSSFEEEISKALGGV